MDPDRLRSLAVVPTARFFAVLTLMCLWFCAPVRVTIAQSSTSETPGIDSPRNTRPIRAGGVIQGLFIMKTQPIYPPAAIAAGISGTVVLEATIAGTGVIANVRVLSGPQMLQQESLNAVRTWRCRPFLINDVPTERKVKINLIFTLEKDGRATIKTTQDEPEIAKTPSPADDAKTQDNRSQNPAAPIKISTAIECSGGCAQKTEPIYPPIAKAAKISGTVVLEAIISKAGSIENLLVVSGPPLLQQASLDAVRTWRYRPYMRNGNPMEAKTTIIVVFALAEDGTATAKATASAPKIIETTPQTNDAKQPESK